MHCSYIVQMIEEDLTHDYLHSSEDNLWSILYLTGYLTRVREIPVSDGALALTIPNAEVKEIFRSTIQKWFKDSSQTWNRQAMFQALWAGELDFIYLDNGATVIVIEHDLDVIRNADYVIDMGLGAEMRKDKL